MAVSISMVLFVAGKSPQNAPSTREVSVFLTDPTPKSAKISGLKNFHICTGSVFFNIILTKPDRIYYDRRRELGAVDNSIRTADVRPGVHGTPTQKPC